MGKQAFVFEVGKDGFGQHVIFNSHKIPVIVQFMGVWSEPCAIMSDLFAELAKEFAEEFIFAKVDIDEQPELKEQYEIKNIPTLIVFKDGEPVRTEVGQLQEVEARSLLKDFGVYRESDLLREQAREQHLSGNTQQAILLLTEAVQKDPGNTRIAMDMVQIFLDSGELEMAKGLFAKLPEADRQTEMGKALVGQLAFANLAAKTDGVEALQQRITATPDDYDAHFDMAVCRVSLYQYPEAMDHLFTIMKKEPGYRQGAARELIVTVSNMLAPVNNDMAQEFRRRLANMLSA